MTRVIQSATLLLCVAATCAAGEVVTFNPSDPIVPNRVTNYYRSASTPDFIGLENTIIYASPIESVPEAQRWDGTHPGGNFQLWKVSGQTVVAMTAGERQALIDAADQQQLTFVRQQAKAALDRQRSDMEMLVRAVVLTLLNDRNAEIAKKHNDLVAWLGTQTTLVNRNQLPSLVITTPTPAQVRAAIQSQIDQGNADQ